VSRPARRRPLLLTSILGWADDHHDRHGTWPNRNSGPISDVPGETWIRVEIALRTGGRNLPGGTTLRRLLREKRGAQFVRRREPFTVERILEWADGHRARTGNWPCRISGPIAESPGVTWKTVHGALSCGRRGLPSRSSLDLVLAEHRGVRHRRRLRDLTIPQILGWATAFHARTGRWPQIKSGPVLEAPGETWCIIDRALRYGERGMLGGTSLARLFAQDQGAGCEFRATRLSIEQILAWADSHHDRHGSWPRCCSGPISEAPGETWKSIGRALVAGFRGLPRGTTLAQLLHAERGGSSLARVRAERRAGRRRRSRPELTGPQILDWARTYRARTGRRPTSASGPVDEAPGETWRKIDYALRIGRRGLPGRSCLKVLLAPEFRARAQHQTGELSIPKILAWADAHHDRHGSWPTRVSGTIPEAPAENWKSVGQALMAGWRGLPSGRSLGQVLHVERNLPLAVRSVPLTEASILAWADAHHARTGDWPRVNTGAIPESPGDYWKYVYAALRNGHRGLPGGSSIAKLLAEHRGSGNPRPRSVSGDPQRQVAHAF
jgi:hypothetical protein